MVLELLPSLEILEKPTYDFVIFDADSTLSVIEGIDELARMKGVEDQVVHLTHAAMNGEIPFDEVYFRRFEIIKPTYEDVIELGYRYCKNITPGALETIDILLKNNIQPYVISGGFNPALKMLTRSLGIPDEHVFANELFEESPFPLWMPDGKQQVVKQLLHTFQQVHGRQPKSAMIGDGISDYEAGQLTNQFICFAGVEARPKVIAKADIVIWEKDLRAVLEYL